MKTRKREKKKRTRGSDCMFVCVCVCCSHLLWAQTGSSTDSVWKSAIVVITSPACCVVALAHIKKRTLGVRIIYKLIIGKYLVSAVQYTIVCNISRVMIGKGGSEKWAWKTSNTWRWGDLYLNGGVLFVCRHLVYTGVIAKEGGHQPNFKWISTSFATL